MSQTELTFIFLGIAALLLIRNILRPDIVALMLLLSLGLTGILTPRETFSGFSLSAVVIMFSAFILAEGLMRLGVTERMGTFILRLFGKGETTHKRLCPSWLFGQCHADGRWWIYFSGFSAGGDTYHNHFDGAITFPASKGLPYINRYWSVHYARDLIPAKSGP